MKIFKKILLCAFALVFLACSSKDYGPKIQASKEKTAEQVNTNPVWDGEIAPSEENNEEGEK